MSTFTTNNGRHINLLDVTYIDHNDDGSLDVYERGRHIRLSGQNAEAFRLATSEKARIQAAQEQQQEQTPS